MLSEEHTKLAKIFIAEAIGTAILLFINCLGCVDNLENFKPTIITASIGAGLALMIAINSFGTISGAHVNPAVTLGALIFKIISFEDAIVYVVAQLVGGVFGHVLVRALVRSEYISDSENFCVNSPQVDIGRAVVIEFVITFILMCVLSAVWDPRNEKYQDSTSMRVGFTVSALVLIAGNLSGGCMNPARSFGPALYNGKWDHHWIYWIGPMLGSFAASILFKNVFLETKVNKGSQRLPQISDEEEQLK
ncbi:hypothetical protein ACKWTF_008517 [Chironomus riparius]